MKRLALIVCGAALVALAWLLLPIYGFYAHRGHLPLPPTGWLSMPDNAPSTFEAIPTLDAVTAEHALDILETHRQTIGAPAISAAVGVDGEVVWAGATGWADLARAQSATVDTRFRIGSTSKAITATLLARLVQAGIVDLDAPISSYYAPLPNPQWRSMTLRQLASHSAGLPHYKENTDYLGLYQTMALRRHYPDVRDALAIFDTSELLHQPGTAFHYSTLGTVLLGATLAEATRSPYRSLVQTYVATPTGMRATTGESPTASGGKPETATSYYFDGERYRPWRSVDLSHRLPGGGFVSTPTDLVRLGNHWLDGQFVSEPLRATFWQPQKLADGTVNEQNYALGFRWREFDVEGVGPVRNANHGGVSRGAQCWLMIVPEQRLVIAISTNFKTENFSDFAMVYQPLLELFLTTEHATPAHDLKNENQSRPTQSIARRSLLRR